MQKNDDKETTTAFHLTKCLIWWSMDRPKCIFECVSQYDLLYSRKDTSCILMSCYVKYESSNKRKGIALPFKDVVDTNFGQKREREESNDDNEMIIEAVMFKWVMGLEGHVCTTENENDIIWHLNANCARWRSLSELTQDTNIYMSTLPTHFYFVLLVGNL